MWKKILGIFLIFFGVLGLFLPILQGTLMIIAGCSLWGVDIKPFLRKFRRKKKEKEKFYK
jgi:drug/metabolite transporter (DMT)-like permease